MRLGQDRNMAKAGGPDKDRGGKVPPDRVASCGTVLSGSVAARFRWNTLTPNGGFYFDGTTWMAVPSPPVASGP